MRMSAIFRTSTAYSLFASALWEYQPFFNEISSPAVMIASAVWKNIVHFMRSPAMLLWLRQPSGKISAIYENSSHAAMIASAIWKKVSHLRKLQPISYDCISHLEKHQPFKRTPAMLLWLQQPYGKTSSIYEKSSHAVMIASPICKNIRHLWNLQPCSYYCVSHL